MRKAFTLAEVLITLVIIGVIAALTIPSLLNSTNQQETITGVKKVYSQLSTALQNNYAKNGESLSDIEDKCEDDSNCWYDEFYSKNFNIISSMAPADSKACTSWEHGSYDITFYTADGMAYSISGGNILVDINGDKKPNEYTTEWSSEVKLNDGFGFSFSTTGHYDSDIGAWKTDGDIVEAEAPATAIIENIDCTHGRHDCDCNACY
ncbi:MAG: type II secretion system protein [Candidatus Gastranaerophilales bacterium]|nr:type II secretion system protein [Candidatus Gastranaerophilales bacterium]